MELEEEWGKLDALSTAAAEFLPTAWHFLRPFSIAAGRKGETKGGVGGAPFLRIPKAISRFISEAKTKRLGGKKQRPNPF